MKIRVFIALTFFALVCITFVRATEEREASDANSAEQSEKMDWNDPLDGSGKDTVFGINELLGSTSTIMEHLLYPLSVEEFLDGYWDRSPFVIHRCAHIDKHTGKRIALDGKHFADEEEEEEENDEGDDEKETNETNETNEHACSSSSCNREGEEANENENHHVNKYTSSSSKSSKSSSKSSKSSTKSSTKSSKSSTQQLPEPMCSSSDHTAVLDYYADLVTSEDIEFPVWQHSEEPISDKRKFKSGGRMQFKELHNAFANGQPVIIDLENHHIRKVHRLMSYLEHFILAATLGELYLTPNGKRFTSPHFKYDNSFILQLEGSSTWRIYDHRVPYPSSIRSGKLQTTFKRVELDPPQFEVTLNAGDFLFIPRGWVHDGNAVKDNYSFHLRIGVDVAHFSWSEMLHSVVYTAAFKDSRSPLASFLDQSANEINEKILHSFINQAARSDPRFRQHFKGGLWGGKFNLFSEENYNMFKALLRCLFTSSSFDETPVSFRNSIIKAMTVLWKMFDIDPPSAWGFITDNTKSDDSQVIDFTDELVQKGIEELELDTPPVVIPPTVYPAPFYLDTQVLHSRQKALKRRQQQQLQAEKAQALSFQSILNERAAIQAEISKMEKEEARRKRTGAPPLTEEEKRAYPDPNSLPALPVAPTPVDWYKWRLTKISFHSFDRASSLDISQPPQLSYLPDVNTSSWFAYANALVNMLLGLEEVQKPNPVASLNQLDEIKEMKIDTKLRGIAQPVGMLHILYERGALTNSLLETLKSKREAVHPDVKSILYPSMINEEYPYCMLSVNGAAVPVPRLFVIAFQYIVSKSSISTEHLKFEQRVKHQELKEELMSFGMSVDTLQDIDLREESLRTYHVTDIPLYPHIIPDADVIAHKLAVARIAVYLGLAEIIPTGEK